MHYILLCQSRPRPEEGLKWWSHDRNKKRVESKSRKRAEKSWVWRGSLNVRVKTETMKKLSWSRSWDGLDNTGWLLSHEQWLMGELCSEHNKQHTVVWNTGIFFIIFENSLDAKTSNTLPMTSHSTLSTYIHKPLYRFTECMTYAHSMFLNLTSTHVNKWKRLHWCGGLLEPPPRLYSWLPGYPYLHPQGLCYLHPPPRPATVTPERWGRRLQLTEQRRTWHSCKAQIPFRSLIQEGCHRKRALTRDREAHHSQTVY